VALQGDRHQHDPNSKIEEKSELFLDSLIVIVSVASFGIIPSLEKYSSEYISLAENLISILEINRNCSTVPSPKINVFISKYSQVSALLPLIQSSRQVAGVVFSELNSYYWPLRGVLQGSIDSLKYSYLLVNIPLLTRYGLSATIMCGVYAQDFLAQLTLFVASIQAINYNLTYKILLKLAIFDRIE